jgi:hypothetical protein
VNKILLIKCKDTSVDCKSAPNEKEAKIVLTITLLVCFALATATAVRADTSASVYIMDPTNPANGGLGLLSGG